MSWLEVVRESGAKIVRRGGPRIRRLLEASKASHVHLALSGSTNDVHTYK